jgi:lipopolysaccharide export system ATP-binding protein
MHILKAEHLEKIYKKRKVVQDISLQIKSTEIVGLLGPNGAGKTTSFYMIVGLVPPSNGEIFLDKQNITNLAMHERARLGVGYLPQEASVFRKLSVADNIMGILELIPNLSKEARARRLEKLLKEFHIEHLRSNIGISLSGGERR